MKWSILYLLLTVFTFAHAKEECEKGFRPRNISQSEPAEVDEIKQANSPHNNKKTPGRKRNKWMSYQEAKAYIRKQGIQTSTQFEELSKSRKKPKNLPSKPNLVYEEWKSWGDFLETKNISPIKREYMNFEEARIFIQKAGITLVQQFRKWSKSEQRPNNFPSAPWRTYNKEWVSWPHFFGTERKWMGFEEAKAYIQKQGIQTTREFRKWRNSEKKPENFPSHPPEIYKDQWSSWGDFLGTGNTKPKPQEWMSYQEAKAFIQSQGIQTIADFEEWKKFGKRPENFPSAPWRVYAEEWMSWSSFLGTKNIAPGKRKWMGFEEAKAYIQKQGIQTNREFRRWRSSEKRPVNFPTNPNIIYKDQWIDWGDFLDTGNTKPKPQEWMSYQEAKAFIQSLGISNPKNFIEWLKSKDRPVNFPSQPQKFYPEWINTKSFLSSEKHMSYEEAKIFISRAGLNTSENFFEMLKLESDFFPENFPLNPKTVYKKSGEWKSWDDFLGLANSLPNKYDISNKDSLSKDTKEYNEDSLSENTVEYNEDDLSDED